MNQFQKIYKILLKTHNPQGWWPLLDHKGTNPTKTGSITGYHPNNFTYPKTQNQIFEICIGAILTQNTAWPNVEKTLLNLKKLNAIDPKEILKIDTEILKQAIKPAGYFNQKTKKLKEFTKFFLSLKTKTPTREQLLNIWGIGPETADSILLYAYKIPVFVIDTYTRRIFSNLQIINKEDPYEEIRSLFQKNLKPDFKIYQEYHALIVEHAKQYYKKKTEYNRCPLLDQI